MRFLVSYFVGEQAFVCLLELLRRSSLCTVQMHNAYEGEGRVTQTADKILGSVFLVLP